MFLTKSSSLIFSYWASLLSYIYVLHSFHSSLLAQSSSFEHLHPLLIPSIITTHITSLSQKRSSICSSLFEILTPMGSFRSPFILLHCGVWVVYFCPRVPDFNRYRIKTII